MNVYTYFDETEHAPVNQAEMLRIWVRSWRARGWRPRILTIRNAAKHPEFEKERHDPQNLPLLAASAVNAKLYCDTSIINFSFTPREAKRLKESFSSVYLTGITYLADGWEKARLVRFENCHDVSLIEHCGRPL